MFNSNDNATSQKPSMDFFSVEKRFPMTPMPTVSDGEQLPPLHLSSSSSYSSGGELSTSSTGKSSGIGGSKTFQRLYSKPILVNGSSSNSSSSSRNSNTRERQTSQNREVQNRQQQFGTSPTSSSPFLLSNSAQSVSFNGNILVKRPTRFFGHTLIKKEQDDVSIIQEGFLLKEGSNWKTWKRRFFTLKSNGELSYKKDFNEKSPIRVMNVIGAEVSDQNENKKQNRLKIIFNNKLSKVNSITALLIVASSETECRIWKKSLEIAGAKLRVGGGGGVAYSYSTSSTTSRMNNTPTSSATANSGSSSSSALTGSTDFIRNAQEVMSSITFSPLNPGDFDFNENLVSINSGEIFILKEKLIRNDQLEIGQKVGQGAQASVHKASIANSKQEFLAVKLFPKKLMDGEADDLSQCYNEISVLSSVPLHPNIIRFHGVCDLEQSVGIVIDYCPGGSLTNYIVNNKGNIGIDEKVKILLGIALGIQHLHKNNVIHRDIKGENMLFSAENEVVIIDFGVATLINNTEEENNCVGTAAFIAPEIVCGESAFTEKVDIYSFGMIMYMLGFEKIKPYGDMTDLEILRKIKKDRNYRPPMNFSSDNTSITNNDNNNKLGQQPSSSQQATIPRWYKQLMSLCLCSTVSLRPSIKSCIGTLMNRDLN